MLSIFKLFIEVIFCSIYYFANEISIFHVSKSIASDVETSYPEKKALLDLPVEVLLDIFDYPDLKSAVSVARSHHYNRIIADEVIKRLISDKSLDIAGCAYAIVGNIIICHRQSHGFHNNLRNFQIFWTTYIEIEITLRSHCKANAIEPFKRIHKYIWRCLFERN